MCQVSLLGCGFVADLYLRSLQSMEGISVAVVHDRDPARLERFCTHWQLPRADTLEGFLAAVPEGSLVLNLTNPEAHYALNRACLEAGHHLYSEKPLAMDVDEAKALYALAEARGLLLASAPCSVLGEAAQTLGHALRHGVAGTPRVVYAELDDGFIPQAAYRKWLSETGAPWPFDDEFRVGCIQNHLFHRTACIIYAYGIKGYTSATEYDADLSGCQKLSLYTPCSGGLPDFEPGCHLANRHITAHQQQPTVRQFRSAGPGNTQTFRLLTNIPDPLSRL